MKALGLILLFVGFIGWGALTFWLPSTTGDVVASTAFEDENKIEEIELSASDAPVNIILAVDHLVPTNISDANRLVNSYSVQLMAPDGLLINESASLVVTGTSSNRGSRMIAQLNMMTLDEVQTGTYKVFLFEDSEPVLQTFNFGVVAISNAMETPAWANMAALATGGLGVVFLILRQLGAGRPRITNGAAAEQSGRTQPNPPKTKRRWGRQGRSER